MRSNNKHTTEEFKAYISKGNQAHFQMFHNQTYDLH